MVLIGASNRTNRPAYMCNSTEYTATTDKEDGSTLIVVDDTTHKIVGYYMAFNGYWCTLS